MRLRLADKGSNAPSRMIYKRDTGQAFACPGLNEGLSNRAVRRERRAARTRRRVYRIHGREQRHDARVDARGEKTAAKIRKNRPDDEEDVGGSGAIEPETDY